MARPAKKKVANKTPEKGQKSSTKTLSAIDKVEQGFRSAQEEVLRQQDSLRSARSALRVKRTEALEKGTRASQAMVDRAYAAVAKGAVSLDESHRKARMAKAKLKAEKILCRVESAELAGEQRLLALEVKLAEQAEEHLKATLEKFEVRWRKKRALTDARKLRVAKRQARLKTQTLAKKAQSEIRAVEKKAAKSTAKPVKAPGRPGRPKKQDSTGKTSVATGAPSKRGRPAKPKTASVAGAEPKKQGRPPKATASNTAAARSSVSTPSKRGRPPKAKPAAPKTKVSTRTASKTGTAGQVPKRRGRPPKAK